jgi:hypothetical protein
MTKQQDTPDVGRSVMCCIIIRIKDGKPTGDVFFTEYAARDFCGWNPGTTYTLGTIKGATS